MCIRDSFLFISYEAVIASGTLGATRTFNDWKTIDDYWISATSGLSPVSYTHLDVYKRQDSLLCKYIRKSPTTTIIIFALRRT